MNSSKPTKCCFCNGKLQIELQSRSCHNLDHKFTFLIDEKNSYLQFEYEELFKNFFIEQLNYKIINYYHAGYNIRAEDVNINCFIHYPHDVYSINVSNPDEKLKKDLQDFRILLKNYSILE